MRRHVRCSRRRALVTPRVHRSDLDPSRATSSGGVFYCPSAPVARTTERLARAKARGRRRPGSLGHARLLTGARSAGPGRRERARASCLRGHQWRGGPIGPLVRPSFERGRRPRIRSSISSALGRLHLKNTHGDRICDRCAGADGGSSPPIVSLGWDYVAQRHERAGDRMRLPWVTCFAFETPARRASGHQRSTPPCG